MGLFAAARPALTLALVCIAVAGLPDTAYAQADGASVCDLRTEGRIVAIGDVHGAYDQFVAILRAAGLVDRRARWIGGQATLVQTGDVLDRGPDSRRVLDLLQRLEREAARDGGRVHALLGNHEAMRLLLQWNDVSAREYAAFRTPDSREARDQLYDILRAEAAARARDEDQSFDERAFRARFEREVPLGYIEMRHAFGSDGDYGRWLRDRPAMVRINGVVFVHGGVDEAAAALGCAGINEAVRRDVTAKDTSPESVASMLAASATGPLWYRGLADADDPSPVAVAAALRALDARAVVVGHTPVRNSRITSRADGRVITIDTGMLGGSSYPGGAASALEIDGDQVTAIYLSGREPLPPLPVAVP